MARPVCPQCGRTIPADTIRPEGHFCPWCGWQGKPPPLDERPAATASKVTPSPDEREPRPESALPQPPEETFQFTIRHALGRALWSGFYLTTATALLVTGTFAVLGVFFFVGGVVPLARLPAMPRVVAFFFAFAWCFVSIVGFPASLWWAVRSRRRIIRVSNGRLIVQIGRSKKEIDLADCAWKVQNVACDSYGAYFPGRPLVVVGYQKQWYACGFSEEKRKHWKRFLRAAGVRQITAHGSLMLIGALLGGMIGGTIGALVGEVAALFGAPPMLRAAVGFLGFLDGAVAVLMYFALLFGTLGRTGRAGAVALVAVVFAAFGVKLGIAGGPPGLAIVPLSNGLLGVIIGWYVYGLAMRRRQQDREASAP